MKSESLKLIMAVTDPKGRELDRQMGAFKMNKKFDVRETGQYQLCITNQDNDEVLVDIMLQTGEFTEERNTAITKKHLKPVEMHAFKVEQMI